MKKPIALLLFVFLFINCSVQKSTPSKVDTADYFKTITTESLQTNLSVIASDEMQGRDTGSEGQKKAGRYIIEFYKKHGVGFPIGATDYYQHIPAAFLNAKYNENLPDSENLHFVVRW